MNTLVKWCALCGKYHPHTIQRESVDGRGRDFVVTDGMCTLCRERSKSRHAVLKETIDRVRRAL